MPLVVVNPAAGRGRVARLLPRIKKLVGDRARVLVTEGPGHATRAVAESAEERIVAVGGDGTIHEVLRGLRKEQVLGVVPVGSGNDFARMLGLNKLSLPEAIERALSAPARRVDLGRVNGEPYGVSLGFGFDAGVARRALVAPRALVGMPRYLYAIFAELKNLSLPRLELRSQGKQLYFGPVLLAAVMNGTAYGGGIPVAPMADPADGRLEAMLAGRFSRAGVLFILPRLILGRHLSHPEVHHFSAPEFELVFDRPTPYHADGEYLGEGTRFRAWVEPGGLLVAA